MYKTYAKSSQVFRNSKNITNENSIVIIDESEYLDDVCEKIISQKIK